MDGKKQGMIIEVSCFHVYNTSTVEPGTWLLRPPKDWSQVVLIARWPD